MNVSRTKIVLLCCLLLSFSIPPVFSSAETERLAVLLGSQDKYFHRAIARAVLEQGSSQDIDVYIQYIEKKSTNSKIQNSFDKNVDIAAYEVETEKHSQEFDELVSGRREITHTFYENTLLTLPFIAGQILLHVKPKNTRLSVFPWTFVGFAIDELAQAQLELARKNTTEILHIHMFVSEKETLFQKNLIESILGKLRQNEGLFLHHLTDENRTGLYHYLETKQVFEHKDFSVISLNDAVAIAVGDFLQKNNLQDSEGKNKGKNNRQIIGFGGSEEVRLAIQEGIVDASILPDYQDYASKILKSMRLIQDELKQIRIEQQELRTYRAPLSANFISFEVLTKQ